LALQLRFPFAFLVLASASPALAADEIHWTLNDPRSVTFDWRGANDTLRYGFTTNYGYRALGATPDPLPFSSPGPFYEAKLRGLIPGFLYHYSVGGGPDHVFRSAPMPGSAFTVYVEADVGDRVTYPRVAAVQSLIADGRPDWVLVVGDLTYGNDNGQAAVDEHFDDVMTWSQDAAYMPAWGNHEWDAPTDDLRNYKGRFGLPNAQISPGAPAAGCCGEDWYWFDYGSVRFIGYPEPYPGAWKDWFPRAATLMDAAQADTAIHVIVTFGHRPAYSSGLHAGDPQLASYLDALGDSHSKYVLNLNGHSHDYERSTPQHGVTHVTVGIGGSTLEQESGSCPWAGGCPPPPWSAFRAYHHGALRLRFDGDRVLGDAMCGPPGDQGANLDDITCAPGDVFDSFVLGGDRPPVVVAPTQKSVPVSSVVVVRVTAHDPDGDPIHSLTADLSQLPIEDTPTFRVDSTDTIGVLTWITDSDDVGTYVVSFHAQNASTASASTILGIQSITDTLPGSLSFSLERAAPNPAASGLTVAYTLASADPVSLELSDVSGRVVARRDLGSPGPGHHSYLVERTLAPAAGVYWIRLIQSGVTRAQKVAFLR
jgi:hypothetical protein